MDTESLRLSAGPLWDALIEHPFPNAMADATLEPEVFRWYVGQNILYLADYARALAAGCAGAESDRDLGGFAAAVTNIVSVELAQNRALLDRIDALCARPADPSSTVAGPATVAYGSWLRTVAARGEPALTYAAILPCAWSYGDIGRSLVDRLVPHPVYADWIAFFASPEYDLVVQGLRDSCDLALSEAGPRVAERAGGVFITACRLERQFWDAGLSCQTWPDLAGPGAAERQGHRGG